MKFEILKDEMFAVPANGYVLDLDEKCENVKRGEVYDDFGYPIKANLDSFFDLDDAKLCRGDDGELYAVEFKPITEEPLIWCPVKKQ